MRKSDNDGTPRPCRAYRSRTTKVVTRALRDWAYVFGQPMPAVDLPTDVKDCLSFSKVVKGLLADCPSSSEEERMAWQSVKKLLPASCKCMETPLLQGVVNGFARPARSLPSGYLAFLEKETRRLFPKGWDVGLYEESVLSCSPGLSGTVDSIRSHGGCQSDWRGKHSEFLDGALNGYYPGGIERCAELMVVQSAGKPRPLTKFSGETLLLKPLHTSIYDRLRRCRWLSVGDVTDASLARAGFRKEDGEVLTSGDYKSATDQLSIEAAERILGTLLSNSACVPAGLQQEALKILRPTLFHEKLAPEGIEPRVGQMMGSFLSFPLLCLQNRFAFLWAMRSGGLSPAAAEKVPCLINGDDILFSSTPRVSEGWMKLVGDLGLEVERTKTSVAAEFGSLNSTLFRWAGVHLRVVPTLRFGRLRSSQYVNSLSRELRMFVAGLRNGARFRAGVVFFRWHLGLLRSTRLTLLELGFRGTLAARLSELFRLAPCEQPRFDVPPAPVGHNVVVSTDLATWVPEDSVSAELSVLNARETASWKFGLDFVNSKDRCTIRYFMRLSAIRRPVLVFTGREGWRGRLSSETKSARSERLAGWFQQPLEQKEKRLALMDSLISSTQFNDFDCPPSYSETVGGGLRSRQETGCCTLEKEKMRMRGPLPVVGEA
ncbi:RNA-dependent RNA polymerase [Erysiphe necator associated ourmia-like virus 13]|nr:RNA-dependent RNA polymerase [Erysiphe necator associated ourmia-like virus 13]